MDSKTILIIINVAFFAFILIGFFIGLKGLKKSLLGLVFFIAGIVIAGIITPLISKAVLNIQITVDGSHLSIHDYLYNLITSSPNIGELVSGSTSLAGVLDNYPLMIVNLAVFMVLIYVVNAIMGIFYAITSAIFFKSNKKTEDKYILVNGVATLVKDKDNSSNHRLWGGLVGAIKGFILIVVTLIPISGLCSLYSDITSPQVVVAEEIVEPPVENLTPTDKLINDYIPKQVIDIINVYNTSIVAKVSSVGNFDDFCFSNIASCKVEGEKIELRQEVVTLSEVYNKADIIINLDFSDINNIKNLDFEELTEFVNLAFNSKTINLVGLDILNFYLDDAITGQTDPFLKDVLNVLKTSITSSQGNKLEIKNEVLSVVNLAKVLVSTKLLDEFTGGSINYQNILDIMTANENKNLIEILDAVINSDIIQGVAVAGINNGLTSLNKFLTEKTGTEVNVGELKSDIIFTKNELMRMLDNIILVYNDIKEVDFETIKGDYTLLLDLNLSKILPNVAKVLDSVIEMKPFASTEIYNNILNEFKKTDYNNYINFDILSNTEISKKVFENQFDYVVKSYEAIKDSGTIDIVKAIIKNTTIDEKQLLNLVSATNNKTGNTYLNDIVTPLLKMPIAKNAIETALDLAEEQLLNFVKSINDKVTEVKLNLSAFIESEYPKIVSMLESSADYLKTLDFTNLSGENLFNAILDSNLTKLGVTLDKVKSLGLFGATDSYKGLYNELIDSLIVSEYSNYIDFSACKKTGFSFETELTKSALILTELKAKIISDNGTSVNLLDFILQNGDFNVILKQLTDSDINNIFVPLFDSTLLKPVAVTLINEINKQVKTIVGSELGQSITMIDVNTDLTAQKDEIINIVKKGIGLANSNIDYSKLETIDADIVGGFMNVLEINAYRKETEGVFKNAYIALVEYLKTLDERVEILINQYEDKTTIDWVKLIELSVSFINSGSNSITSEQKNKLVAVVNSMMNNDTEYGEITSALVDMYNLVIEENVDFLTVINGENGLITLKAYTKSKTDKMFIFLGDLTGNTQIPKLVSNNFDYTDIDYLNLLKIFAEIDVTQFETDPLFAFKDIIGKLSVYDTIAKMQKVNNTISLAVDLTGEIKLNDFKDINYSAENTKVELIFNSYNLYTNAVGLEAKAEAGKELIDNLIKSDFLLNMLIKYNFAISIEDNLKPTLITHIENLITTDAIRINLKTIFGLI